MTEAGRKDRDAGIRKVFKNSISFETIGALKNEKTGGDTITSQKG